MVAKIVNFCHVGTENVFSVQDCSSVYEVPILLEKRGILHVIKRKLNLAPLDPEVMPAPLRAWSGLCERRVPPCAVICSYADLLADLKACREILK